MDSQARILLRTAPGSVGETTKAYANSYSRILKKCTRDIIEFTTAFRQVVVYRVIAYHQIGKDDNNLLSPISESIFHPIYNFFDKHEKRIKALSSLTEYKDYSSIYIIDLPTMILYTMLLESHNKRMGFASINDEFTIEALRIIYQETISICSYQTFFTEQDFIEENTLKLKLFLFDIDPSLHSIIYYSRSRY